ncbi:MAG: hypothetical protein MI723_19180 [Caulobacterales bacterium]|nr:hypothetical protein [Caulobacterales bacterium]
MQLSLDTSAQAAAYLAGHSPVPPPQQSRLALTAAAPTPVDRVELSATAQARLADAETGHADHSDAASGPSCPSCGDAGCPSCAPAEPAKAGGAVSQGGAHTDELSEEEQAEVDALKARDQEVRAHEAAHAAAGGAYAGQPSYDYETGPDGQRYAVGGEVSIDVAPVEDDPEATIAKMETVVAAALAPAEPSGQDRAVAAQAQAQIAQAQAELAARKRDERTGADPSGETEPRPSDAVRAFALESYARAERTAPA